MQLRPLPRPARIAPRNRVVVLRRLGIGVAASGLLGVLSFVACSSSPSSPVSPPADGSAPAGNEGGVEDSGASPADGTVVLPIGTVDAAGGEPCEASTDCPPGLVCMYPLAQGCSATGACTVLAAAQCAGPYCSCRGDTTAVCGDFGRLPMEVPLRGPPCGATNDDGGGD